VADGPKEKVLQALQQNERQQRPQQQVPQQQNPQNPPPPAVKPE
jgi:hypothetical protein